MDKGRYVAYACITLSGFCLYLEGRDAADVIAIANARINCDQPSNLDLADSFCPSVIGPDHSQPMLPHLDNWLGSDPDMPPGEQHTVLPWYPRRVTQHYIQGTPLPLLQMEDELPVAA